MCVCVCVQSLCAAAATQGCLLPCLCRHKGDSVCVCVCSPILLRKRCCFHPGMPAAMPVQTQGRQKQICKQRVCICVCLCVCVCVNVCARLYVNPKYAATALHTQGRCRHCIHEDGELPKQLCLPELLHLQTQWLAKLLHLQTRGLSYCTCRHDG